jgi:hypothetical protein
MNYCVNRLIKAVDEVGGWLDVVKVPLYSGPFSRKLYTQHQLLTCWWLRLCSGFVIGSLRKCWRFLIL